LIDSLPEGTIRWGHKVTAIRPVEAVTGRHEVEFADGSTITTDLLIGADGAWSKARPLLTDAWPSYTGVSFIEADLFDADEKHPVEAAAMGEGMLFAFEGQKGVLGHKETDGSLHVYLGFRAAEDWIDTIDFADDHGSKQAILDLLPGWDDSLRGMISNADTLLTPRRINALPVGVAWERVPGITLLGEAAHGMSPFAGEGANLAMYDGALLAESIATHRDDTEAALAVYEAELFPRSTEAARDSAEGLETLFNDESPKTLVDMFAAFDQQAADGHEGE
jgi:2-polyprenyl-6-methoxyphenol hydroxylase-like FAD-dependent oxidoreductase